MIACQELVLDFVLQFYTNTNTFANGRYGNNAYRMKHLFHKYTNIYLTNDEFVLIMKNLGYKSKSDCFKLKPLGNI